jgi:hypothetical protein
MVVLPERSPLMGVLVNASLDAAACALSGVIALQ